MQNILGKVKKEKNNMKKEKKAAYLSLMWGNLLEMLFKVFVCLSEGIYEFFVSYLFFPKLNHLTWIGMRKLSE